jgi:hypothetical protein
MRKLYIFILTLVVTGAHGQSVVKKITHDYFRSDPFETSFSSFLTHLLNDPGLTDKTMKKKTDSSLFYFSGTYSEFNPFFFKPKKTKVVLTELPIKISASKMDTVYQYQLFAYADESKNTSKDLKKEFDKIFKRYKGSFYKTSLTENPDSAKINSATYNFFEPMYSLAPFALTWAGPDASKEICLILTIRMNTKDNKAVLPVPFYAL